MDPTTLSTTQDPTIALTIIAMIATSFALALISVSNRYKSKRRWERTQGADEYYLSLAPKGDDSWQE